LEVVDVERLGKLFVALLILSAFFWLVESLFAANPRQPRVIGRRGLGTDLVYWFTTPLLTQTIAQIGLAVILMILYRKDVAGIRAMLASRDALLARQPLGLQAVEMLVIGDFIGYWTHRWFHSRRLWKFHAIHHSSEDLDWLSAVRLHPINDWVSRWIQASALIVLGFAPAAVAVYVPFLTFYAIFVHANVGLSFGRLVASPKFHRWHHTSEDEGLDKNFAGLLPFIDVLFGTYYMPKGRLPERFGLKNECVPEGLVGQLVYPFRRTAARADPKPVA
jgi:sterol desaturase/sphingolipid hydroxylase (fatty acid hydroxylase superfamily)